MENGAAKTSLVVFQNSHGHELQGGLHRLSRHGAAFEVYGADAALRTSEILKGFKVYSQERIVYSGRAVVRELVNTGTVTVCETNLDAVGFDTDFFTSIAQLDKLREHFDGFVLEWQKICQVQPEFKVAVADLQTFLIDLRCWSEQIEVGLQSSPQTDRVQLENEAIEKLSPQVVAMINDLFARFEEIAKSFDRESQPIHRGYAQRLLHPIVLCAPFACRTYQKPLGYAGDYEMVNMMLRDPKEGASLFAKIFNVWLLQQQSATAHRNRIQLLRERLVQETLRCSRHGRPMRVLNLGCGPASEIQQFLAEGVLADHAQFMLFDFNDETVSYATQLLGDLKRRLGRQTEITIQKKSVHHLLKESNKPMAKVAERDYDFVYCSGLFDYLSDRTCKQLMNIFWSWTRPDGLVLATNVTPGCPNRGSLELLLDWNLNYRHAGQFAKLAPDGVPADGVRIFSDDTGLNIFLEARKSDD